jgi:transcriptional regulator with PAS, ATPase and Fis domain
MIEQAIVRTRSGADLEMDSALLFPDEAGARGRPRRGRPKRPISPQEARRIREAMVTHFGNQSKAAEELGMSRFTLKRRLAQMKDE